METTQSELLKTAPALCKSGSYFHNALEVNMPVGHAKSGVVTVPGFLSALQARGWSPDNPIAAPADIDQLAWWYESIKAGVPLVGAYNEAEQDLIKWIAETAEDIASRFSSLHKDVRGPVEQLTKAAVANLDRAMRVYEAFAAPQLYRQEALRVREVGKGGKPAGDWQYRHFALSLPDDQVPGGFYEVHPEEGIYLAVRNAAREEIAQFLDAALRQLYCAMTGVAQSESHRINSELAKTPPSVPSKPGQLGKGTGSKTPGKVEMVIVPGAIKPPLTSLPESVPYTPGEGCPTDYIFIPSIGCVRKDLAEGGIPPAMPPSSTPGGPGPVPPMPTPPWAPGEDVEPTPEPKKKKKASGGGGLLFVVAAAAAAFFVTRK